MRIGFFTDDYLPTIHGVTRSMEAFRAGLEARGHEVFVIAPSHPDAEIDDHVLRLPSVSSRWLAGRRVMVFTASHVRSLAALDLDVVHSHTQFTAGVLAHQVARQTSVPHVSTLHTVFPELRPVYPTAVRTGTAALSVGYPIIYGGGLVHPFRPSPAEIAGHLDEKRLDRQFWRLTVRFMNNTSLCVTPSRHVAQTLAAHGLSTPSAVLPNGVDVAAHRADATASGAVSTPWPVAKTPGERWIVCVGRLSGEKRQSVLVEALARLADPTVRLVLVGDGPALPEVRALAQSLGVAERVTFTGAASAAEVRRVLRHGDVFTLASYRFDNQPMVILEALAAGLPIVYCDDRLVEGLTAQNAVLTDGPSAACFAETFAALLADAPRLDRLAEGSAALAPRFDIAHQSEQLEQHYLACAPVLRRALRASA